MSYTLALKQHPCSTEKANRISCVCFFLVIICNYVIIYWKFSPKWERRQWLLMDCLKKCLIQVKRIFFCRIEMTYMCINLWRFPHFISWFKKTRCQMGSIYHYPHIYMCTPRPRELRLCLRSREWPSVRARLTAHPGLSLGERAAASHPKHTWSSSLLCALRAFTSHRKLTWTVCAQFESHI